MARVKLLGYQGASPELREFYDRTFGGREPQNIYKSLGNAPEALARLHNAVDYFRKEPVIPKYISELAILLVARRLGSEYVYKRHARMAINFGATEAQALAVGTDDKSPFDERELAALAFVEEYVAGPRAKDSTFEALRKHFNDQQIVELAIISGLYWLTSRFTTIMELEDELADKNPF